MRWILFSCLFAIGCGEWTVPVNQSNKPTKPEPAVATTVWTVMADYVDNGAIDNTDKMILVVDRLRERDAITDNDKASFYETFPGIKQKRRDTTEDDSKRLRGMK